MAEQQVQQFDCNIPGLVYVFVQFGNHYVQDFKNSIISRHSILKGYKGKCLGIATQTDVVEGCWRDDRAISVFEFPTGSDALMWLESDPEVRQEDFMNGADIVIVPTFGAIPPNKTLFQLLDLKIYDLDTYMDQYVGGHLGELTASGGVNSVGTPTHMRHRGSWMPGFIAVNQWEGHDDFYKWYRSDEYNYKWKQYRLESAETNMILFELEPLFSEPKTEEAFACW